MKVRHPSEAVFFELMAAASFTQVTTILYPLPGDNAATENTVYLYIYRYRI